MTKEEICKVLECCSSPEYRCNECPIDQKKKDDCECGTFCMGEALTLIKELTEECTNLHASCTELERKCASLNDENERVKAATVREFAEKAKSKFNDCFRYVSGNREYFIVGNELIDKIAEEMIGGAK